MTEPRRPLRQAAGVGVLAGLAVAAVAFLVVVVPLFFLARAVDPARGTGRPFVGTGLTRVAVPAALVAGSAAGVAVGVWYRRGGSLPREEDGGSGS